MNNSFFGEFDHTTQEQWKEAAIAALKGAPFEKVMFTDTYEGIRLEPIYDKQSYERLARQMKNLPGFVPYLRGTNATGKKFLTWDIAQKLDYPLPGELNKALKEDLQKGQNCVYIDFTSYENSSDHPFTDITNINSLADFEQIFEDIDISDTPIYLKNSILPYSSAPLLLAYLASKRIKLKGLKGAIFNDPLCSLLTHGTLKGSIKEHLDYIASNIYTFEDADIKLFASDASVYHNGGADAVTELALSLATAVYYLRELQDRKIDINIAARKIAFVFPIGTHFFMEISKLRAARILWAKIVESFGGDEESQKMFIHAETSLRETTKYDPWVNMLRATSETFSAIAGSADSISVTNYDKLWGLPGEFSRRNARNIQNVLKYESHLNDTADPAGGSYFVESLTLQIAQKAWDKFRAIEEQGGIYDAIKNEFVQNEVNTGYLNRIKNISIRKDVILGTNKYPNLTEKAIENTYKSDKTAFAAYATKIKEIIDQRNSTGTSEILDEIPSIPKILPDLTIKLGEAFKEGSLVHEPVARIFSGNETAKEIPLKRSSQVFEDLREASFKHKSKHGSLPKIHLVCWGALREYKARADFAADFFQVGGFETQQISGFNDFDDLAKSLMDFEGSVFVFCSTDDKYEEFVPRISTLIKKVKPFTKLVLAGYPKEKIEEYTNAGVDRFIHTKANIYEILNELQKDLGIRK